MGNQVEIILENIMSKAGREICASIVQSCGALGEKPTPARQAKYVSAVMRELPKSCDNTMICEIMQSCGYSCLSNGTILKAKKAYAESSDIKEFLDKLNEQHIGGGSLHISNGKIIGIYTKCYCGLAKASKNLSPDYCNCSVGWFKKLFSSVFEKEIIVKKVNTILDGANQCTFEITY